MKNLCFVTIFILTICPIASAASHPSWDNNMAAQACGIEACSAGESSSDDTEMPTIHLDLELISRLECEIGGLTDERNSVSREIDSIKEAIKVLDGQIEYYNQHRAEYLDKSLPDYWAKKLEKLAEKKRLEEELRRVERTLQERQTDLAIARNGGTVNSTPSSPASSSDVPSSIPSESNSSTTKPSSSLSNDNINSPPAVGSHGSFSFVSYSAF